MSTGNLVTVLPIVIICYFAGICTKAFKPTEKYIQIISGFLGGLLGLLGYYTMADFPSDDLMTSFAIGIISGLTSSGFNKTVKNIIKRSKSEKKVDETISITEKSYSDTTENDVSSQEQIK